MMSCEFKVQGSKFDNMRMQRRSDERLVAEIDCGIEKD